MINMCCAEASLTRKKDCSIASRMLRTEGLIIGHDGKWAKMGGMSTASISIRLFLVGKKFHLGLAGHTPFGGSSRRIVGSDRSGTVLLWVSGRFGNSSC